MNQRLETTSFRIFQKFQNYFQILKVGTFIRPSGNFKIRLKKVAKTGVKWWIFDVKSLWCKGLKYSKK